MDPLGPLNYTSTQDLSKKWLVESRGSYAVKFIYSEKATKFCEISTLLLTVCTVDKSKVKISQNFVAFSEYTNFKSHEYS